MSTPEVARQIENIAGDTTGPNNIISDNRHNNKATTRIRIVGANSNNTMHMKGNTI